MSYTNIKDNNNMSNIRKNSNGQNVFDKDSSFNSSLEFARAKAERLASAVYMVTSFISENDPIRIHMREASLQLLSKLSLRNISKEENISQELISNIVLEIVGLLDVSHMAGYVSNMNFEILRGEYIDFVSFLRNRKDMFASDGQVFSRKFFDTTDNRDNGNNTLDTGKLVANEMTMPVNGVNTRSNFHLNHNSSGLKQLNQIRNNAEKAGAVVVRRDSRRDAILNLLKKQKKVTVKDIASVVKNCSEKTMQRELISLVEEGVLRKEGERRWSTYFLA